MNTPSESVDNNSLPWQGYILLMLQGAQRVNAPSYYWQRFSHLLRFANVEWAAGQVYEIVIKHKANSADNFVLGFDFSILPKWYYGYGDYHQSNRAGVRPSVINLAVAIILLCALENKCFDKGMEE